MGQEFYQEIVNIKFKGIHNIRHWDRIRIGGADWNIFDFCRVGRGDVEDWRIKLVEQY